MTEGSFTASIPADVIKQIEVREKLWGKKAKTEEELEVINGNTVWAVLRSGVMAPVDEKDRYTIMKSGERPTCSQRKAELGILGGEVLPAGLGSPINGQSVDWRLAGIQLTKSEEDRTSAYRRTELQGFRPMPGITGFTVQTKDTWGMIMEVTINLKVWSRKDLEDMDLIYFKPGYPALFEWGHTLYIREDGSICKNPKLAISNDFFFEGGKFERLDREVQLQRKLDPNREICFGYITNFSYAFKADGSYDCTVKLLSKGAVIEGLKTKDGGAPEESDSQDSEAWWTTSIFHKILKAFQTYYDKKKGSGKPESKNRVEVNKDDQPKYVMPGFSPVKDFSYDREVFSGKKAIQSGFEKNELFSESSEVDKKLSASKKLLEEFPVVVTKLGTGGFWHQSIEGFYIPLRALLHLINICEFYSGEDYRVYFDLLSDARLGHGTDKNIVSLNPIVAVLPGQEGSYQIANQDRIKKYTDSIQDELKDTDIIGNIWIDYSAFCGVVERHVTSKLSGYPILPIFEEFLDEIQKSFGNIHSLGLFVNHLQGSGCFEVVDYSNVRSDKKRELPKDLGVTGLYNTVLDLNVQSDVSNDIVNEMCIAATAPDYMEDGAEETDECMVFWGENCQALWSTSFAGTSNKKDTATGKQAKKDNFEKELKKFFKKLNKLYKKYRRGTLDRKEHGKQVQTDKIQANIESELNYLQLTGEKYYKSFVNRDLKDKGHLQMGILPIKMSLTMLGISRLTVGNTFRIRNGILPRKYDNWGYIITGIDHNIQNGQWVTTLKTQYYPVYPDEIYTSKSTSPDYDTETNTGTMATSSTSSSSQATPKPSNFKDGTFTMTGARTAASNDIPGDASGREVNTSQIKLSTLFNRGYERVYRNDDAETAKKAAAIAVQLAANSLVGYQQSRRRTLYAQLVEKYKGDVQKYLASGVATDTDCSAFCHTCYAAVNPTIYGTPGNPATTRYMAPLISKGTWKTLSMSSDINSVDKLRVGDILWKQGHVEMVTSIP